MGGVVSPEQHSIFHVFNIKMNEIQIDCLSSKIIDFVKLFDKRVQFSNLLNSEQFPKQVYSGGNHLVRPEAKRYINFACPHILPSNLCIPCLQYGCRCLSVGQTVYRYNTHTPETKTCLVAQRPLASSLMSGLTMQA